MTHGSRVGRVQFSRGKLKRRKRKRGEKIVEIWMSYQMRSAFMMFMEISLFLYPTMAGSLNRLSTWLSNNSSLFLFLCSISFHLCFSPRHFHFDGGHILVSGRFLAGKERESCCLLIVDPSRIQTFSSRVLYFPFLINDGSTTAAAGRRPSEWPTERDSRAIKLWI